MLSSILGLVIPIGLKLLEYFLSKNKDDREMMELFYKFIDKVQSEYLNSAKMRLLAKERMKAIMEKPFEES